jgi:hypothetical protein
VDWAVPKSVYSVSEPGAKEEAEIKKEDLDDDEVLGMSASGVDGWDVQTTAIKNEPLCDESEEGDETYSKSDMNESSYSEEEAGHRDEYVNYSMLMHMHRVREYVLCLNVLYVSIRIFNNLISKNLYISDVSW